MTAAALPRRRSRFSLTGTLAAVGGALLCGILVVRLQVPMLERINLEALENAEARKNRNIALATTLGWLGYRNLGASWLWLELIQYYGDAPARAQTGYGLAYEYFDHMLRLDPNFFLGYRLSSLVLTYQAGQPEKAVEILDRGLQQFNPQNNPDAWRLYVDRALINFMFLGDAEAGRRDYYQAAAWREQVGLPGDDFRQLGDNIARSPLSRRSRFDVWLSVFNATSDRDTRQFVLEQLTQLGTVLRTLPTGEIEILPPPLPSGLEEEPYRLRL
ncbi:hypothetical protein NW851_11865 [Synechococcus sp. H55.7]|uniref:hypothetical protein n=1 Tax=unclassified Synechococcus TaxID=2626047 RepID=UPI0039C28E68